MKALSRSCTSSSLSQLHCTHESSSAVSPPCVGRGSKQQHASAAALAASTGPIPSTGRRSSRCSTQQPAFRSALRPLWPPHLLHARLHPRAVQVRGGHVQQQVAPGGARHTVLRVHRIHKEGRLLLADLHVPRAQRGRDLVRCEVAVAVAVKLGEDVLQRVRVLLRGDALPRQDLRARGGRGEGEGADGLRRGRGGGRRGSAPLRRSSSRRRRRSSRRTEPASSCMPGIRRLWGLVAEKAFMKASCITSASACGGGGAARG